MAFIIPNTGDTVSGAKFESLDQAEPDSLDFEILGNIGRSGVLTGCQVSTNGNNSDVQVSAGVVVINGVPYTVTAVSALSLGTLPSHSQFAMVVARLTAGSVSLVLVNGNDDPTNPTYPKTPNTSTSGTINLATDVVLAAIHRDGNKAVTASSIVDKRTILSSSVFSQGTTAPSGGTTGSLYFKNDTASGASGSGVYIRNASGAWIETAQLANNNITDAQLRDSAGLSVIGRSANTTGDPADIVASNDGQVLRRSGTDLGFGQITGAGIASGTITEDKLVAAVIQKLIPAGTVVATVSNTADTGWLLMSGQTVVNAQTLYPALWAVAPTAWRSGSNLVLPNMENKILSGAGTTSLGAESGVNSVTLAENNIPAHRHSIDHGHGHTITADQPQHRHSVDPSGTVTITDPGHTHQVPLLNDGPFTGYPGQGQGGTTLPSYNTYSSTTGITATVDIPAVFSDYQDPAITISGDVTSLSGGVSGYVGGNVPGSAGSTVSFSVRNTHIAVRFQIKAH